MFIAGILGIEVRAVQPSNILRYAAASAIFSAGRSDGVCRLVHPSNIP